MADFGRSHSLLGFDEIVSALTGRANTAAGKQALGETAPMSSRKDAERALDETGAMIDLMGVRADFDIAPCENPLALLNKAVKSQTLTGEEIRAFAPLLRNSEKLSIIFSAEGIEEGHPLQVPLPSIHGLAGLIEEAIDEDGNVRADATPEIERLYKASNSLKQAIREKAESLLKDKGISPMLQDDYVTLRENRFVLPIKAEHKSHIEGIIHDSSNSGQTFFIEPKMLVDLNNRLKTVEMELVHEINRLLADITMMIGEEGEAIEAIHEAIVRLDIISARARFSIDLSCSRPVFGETINVKSVANPVMLLEGKKVERNDIAIRHGARALIISGPNAGGKTVSMKTIGLFSVMARMGLFITAGEGSVIPFYKQIYADIGDSQSIADDLSTFSAHISVIKEITRDAGAGSLVLLDELMVSTDPKEGSALAVATLDHLVSRGADVIVTTHFNELKIIAQSQPEYHNVSMEFDKLEARPTYRIVDGAPGSSSALVVAEKLGLEKSIVASANSRLAGGDERIENALNELKDQKILLERERRYATRSLAEIETLKKETRVTRDKIAERESELAKTAKRKLSADIASARKSISELVDRARSSASNKAVLRETRETLEKMAEQSRRAAAPTEKISQDKLEAGDEVYIVSLERSGRLETAPSDGRAEVALGTMRVTVNAEDIIGTRKSGDRAKSGAVAVPEIYHPSKEGQEPTVELDIRGFRVEEGIDHLVKFMDDAVKKDAAHIRIIHGRGTGALRSAVREYLQRSPYVESFAPALIDAGGDGVTIVAFK